MEKIKIPFNQASPQGCELEYISEAVRSGQVSGNHSFTKRCEEYLEDALGVERVLLTTSCTHALEMSAHLLGVEPGDEVILPSFTFVSTANAFALAGATPVFCDIREDTLNLDEAMLAELITPNTKAIVPVHYAGVGCEMKAISRIAEEHSIPIVEDNAHGLFGKYGNRSLGTFGALATQSFHETKNFSCGEGGALVINDATLIERAEILREKGTDRAKFFKGLVDKYTWVDVGSSYVISDILAGYLLAQLEVSEEIQRKREDVWRRYQDSLQQWAGEQNVRIPFVPEECDQAYHMFYLIMPTERDRDEFIEYMREANIMAVFHYLPLHESPKGISIGRAPLGCVRSEDISRRLVRLPFYNDLNEAVQLRVIESVLGFESEKGKG